MFLIQHITKQQLKFNNAQNHTNDHPNVANKTLSDQKRGFFFAIYKFLSSHTETQDIKQPKNNVSFVMQNQTYNRS